VNCVPTAAFFPSTIRAVFGRITCFTFWRKTTTISALHI